MNCQVVGIEKVDYVSKKTNRPVVGLALYVTYNDNRVIGYAASREYIPQANVTDIPELGDYVKFSYNRYGSIDGYSIIKE